MSTTFFTLQHFADSLQSSLQSLAQRKISKHRNDPLTSRGALSSKWFQMPKRRLLHSPAVAWAWIGSVRLEKIRLDSKPRSNAWTALRLPHYHPLCYSRAWVRSCCLVLTESIKLRDVLQTFNPDHHSKRILALYFPASRLLRCDFLRLAAPAHLCNWCL